MNFTFFNRDTSLYIIKSLTSMIKQFWQTFRYVIITIYLFYNINSVRDNFFPKKLEFKVFFCHRKFLNFI